ncbi:NAD-dependent epimerase/dehydratase family protein [Stakelama marina]|uniref:NAD(P)-dependent oxidoreductase n=1 Tax=Stakelama marina TaxID=2826939 RepID=A0A8T4IC22_9SPHN|nr:NAD(P)-dependent oxidoreductase [Stakelama marina]MBR0552110.1 NAD(P)-dependent oxidoreductase [Stakelama marina]
MRVFLTGASGFIGGEVVKILQSKGYEIANYDIAPPHFPEQTDCWIEADVRDKQRLDLEVANFDPHYLIHLASDIDVAITELDQFTTTIDGTSNVIEAVAKAKSLKRFVHISTQFTVMPGIAPPDESYLQPYTVYGEAKAETERRLRVADLSVPWVILRPTIIWGPHHPSFANQIFRHIATGRYLHPKGSEPIMRAFGYVRNVAAQMVWFMEMPASASNQRVFYLGDDTIDYDRWADAFSVELAGRRARRIPKWLLLLMGRAGDLVKKLGLPSPIDSGRAFRMSTSSAVDLDRTLRLAGPVQVSFEDGVAETVAWLREKDPDLFGKGK